MERQVDTQTGRQRLGVFTYWLLGFVLFWALLSGASGWYLGLPFALLAALMAMAIGLRPWTLQLRALPGFLRFFLTTSLLGAWDVSRRTLRSRPDIQPGWSEYAFSTSDPQLRLLLSAIVGLLPGTLASRIDTEKNVLEVHLLDTGQHWRPTVEQLEVQLTRLLILEKQL